MPSLANGTVVNLPHGVYVTSTHYHPGDAEGVVVRPSSRRTCAVLTPSHQALAVAAGMSCFSVITLLILLIVRAPPAARVPRGIDAFGRSPRRATSKPRDRSSSSARTSPRTSSLCSSATSGNVRAASQRLPQAHRVTAIGSLLSIRWVQEMGVSAGMPCTAQGACVAYVCEVLVHPVHPSGHQERRQRRNSPLVRACTATVSAALNAVLRVLGRWCACCDAAPARSTLSGYRAAHLLRPVLRTAPVRAGAVRDPGPCLDAHRAHCGYRPRLRGNVRAWTVLWDLGPVVRAASRR